MKAITYIYGLWYWISTHTSALCALLGGILLVVTLTLLCYGHLAFGQAIMPILLGAALPRIATKK